MGYGLGKDDNKTICTCSVQMQYFNMFSILISGRGIYTYKGLIANNTRDEFSLIILGSMTGTATFASFSLDLLAEA